MLTTWLVALVACRSGDCDPGFELRDGMCYPADTGAPDSDVTIDTDPSDVADTDPPEDEELLAEILDRLGECPPHGSGDGRIDPDAGCIDDVCCSMTRSEIDALLGTPSSCEPSLRSPGQMLCYWEGLDGVGAEFRSTLDTAAIDTGDGDYPADHVFAFPPSWGENDRKTSGGNGVYSPMACFAEEFGLPSEVDLAWSDENDQWYLAYGEWPFDGIAVYDRWPDGNADLIALCY